MLTLIKIHNLKCSKDSYPRIVNHAFTRTVTQRSEAIIYDGHIMLRARGRKLGETDQTKINWRCSVRKTCSASLQTQGDRVIKINRPHNHQPVRSEIEIK
jgi:hypothetical protein